MSIDHVTYEVVRNALIMTAIEMKSVAMRTSYSTVWREAGDLSCAVLNSKADSIAQGPADLPVHLATMPFSVRGALEKLGDDRLEPGDVLFHNDPAYGNNHLPDTIMIKPVFHRRTIVAYVATRGHWTDIGGQSPGSYSASNTELIQEGLRIPPVKLFRRGRLNEEIVSLILANVREERLRRGDIRAQYASCIAGEKQLLRLVDKYGAAVLRDCMELILTRSEMQTRAEIAKIPEGTYHFTDWCDGDGITRRRIRIEVKVSVGHGAINVDLSGSGRQALGGTNATYAVTVSAVLFAVKCLTDSWNPCNSGSYRPVTVVAPPGTVVNAHMPAPVVAGNHETANIVADAVFGALAKADPKRAIAAGSGSAAVVAIGRTRSKSRGGAEFVHVEPHGGAWGARSDKDGISGIRVGVGNTGNQPVEVVETEYPIEVVSYALVADTGGAGRFRGGLAPRRVYRLLEAATVTISAERARIAPYGLEGGANGSLARYEIRRPGESHWTTLSAKTRPLPLPAGTLVALQPAGGGGFGDPATRDPDALLGDVLDGYVTPTAAEEIYGRCVAT